MFLNCAGSSALHLQPRQEPIMILRYQFVRESREEDLKLDLILAGSFLYQTHI